MIVIKGCSEGTAVRKAKTTQIKNVSEGEHALQLQWQKVSSLWTVMWACSEPGLVVFKWYCCLSWMNPPECQQWHHGCYTQGGCARNMHSASTDLAVRILLLPEKGISWNSEGSTKKVAFCEPLSETHLSNLQEESLERHFPAKILHMLVYHEQLPTKDW